tara:strand:+ start:301 stop:438 length:138 start_codon:yes stop_codon:yes gene_type:complete
MNSRRRPVITQQWLNEFYAKEAEEKLAKLNTKRKKARIPKLPKSK